MREDREALCLPAGRCVLCEKTLEEIGGMRIVAGRFWAVGLTDRYRGGGNPDYPQRSIPLEEGSSRYLLVQGRPEAWSEAAIERARQEFLDGRHPWVCQKCTGQVCSQCGEPINYPMGSDVLHDSGCTTHIAVFGFDPGCSNRNCRKYRKWAWKT